MKKKVWKFSNFSTVYPSLASSHWLRPDLDAPGCYLFSEDLILIVLRKSSEQDPTFYFYAILLYPGIKSNYKC